MTKQEAIVEMKNGRKLTHKHFTDDEWVTIGKNGKMVLEDGVECSSYEFWMWRKDESWDNDWSLFN